MKNILPHNTAITAQITLGLAILAGLSYFFAQIIDVEEFTGLIWKASTAWLLAVFAMLVARNNDGWMITGVMALSALGDVLFQYSFEQGAGAFACAYLIAIILYARNRRSHLTSTQRALGYCLMIIVPLIAWFFAEDIIVMAYAALLGIMSGMAWMSRFPRYWVGIGTIFLVEAELVTFARDAYGGEVVFNYVIWGLYFVGQVMIVLGVTRTLAQPSFENVQNI